MMFGRACVIAFLFLSAGCGPASESPAQREPGPAATPPGERPQRPPATSAAPEMPYEDAGACPFEGCTYREWTAREEVEVLTERRAGAPTAFTVKAGEPVTALTGVVIVTRPGRVTFTERRTIDTSAGPIELQPGDTVYLLTPIGEGHHVAWIGGRIVNDVDGGVGKLVEPVQYDWWAQVRNATGRVGWVRMMRQFDGTDRLA